MSNAPKLQRLPGTRGLRGEGHFIVTRDRFHATHAFFRPFSFPTGPNFVYVEAFVLSHSMLSVFRHSSLVMVSSPTRRPGHRLRRIRRSCLLSIGLLLVTFLQILRYRATFDEQSRESRHPLGSRQMRAVPQSTVNEDLRYVAFGSSTTWGMGLDDVNLSYPFQLSSEARNAASRMGGAALAAACTETIVGDDVFDVITIEFARLDDSHMILAKRLRRRFPKAILLFVRLWKPDDITYTSESGELIDLDTWRLQNGGHSIHSSELALRMMEAGPENWDVRFDDDPLLSDTLIQLGARTATLPTPNRESYAFPQNLLEFLAFFNDDNPRSLTARGHAALAAEIRNAVKTYPTTTRIKGGPIVGTWGAGDQCNMWYYNGSFPASNGRQLQFAQSADGTHKHALEFRPGGGASFRILNKFKCDRMLYLTYMTASDEEDNKVYPRTRVRINSRPSVVLEPYHEGAEGVHLTRTSAVGMIPPGESVIYMDPLESKSQLYFRLVGSSLLGEAAVRRLVPIDFELEPEPAVAL
jgi:hypothetical protein